VNRARPLPQVFKGIALFTPGGDLVYCIDVQKQSHWHLHLCMALQETLGLAEPPHFLVPCYSATIDRWLNPQTQEVHTVAAACPFVLKYQSLLNVLFGTENLVWQVSDRSEGVCDPTLLMTYRQQFPELWQDHDLVMRFEQRRQRQEPLETSAPQGHVFRLFISSHSAATERTLQNLHQILETSLRQPYTLQVIDVHKHPDQAERDQVTATPTLLRTWPHPIRRIVGEFDDANRILQVLAATDEHRVL